LNRTKKKPLIVTKTASDKDTGPIPLGVRIKRALWVTAGTFFLALAIIGIPLPVLPTTPFLLLSAGCYMRGSERMHNWLLNHKYFGEFIRNYQEGRGIPLKIKIWAISVMWIMILLSSYFFISNEYLFLKILLVIVAVGVTIHLIRIKTYKKE
jgi:uncharacterized membrane protein YbaN (DUF454 family)